MGRPPIRGEPDRYLFAGAIRCGHCGKSMFGNTAKSKAYYRCSATRPDDAEPSVAGHPPTDMVREERMAAAVDTLTDGDHIETTVEAVLAADHDGDLEEAEVTRARRQVHQLRIELDRVLAAIRADVDPELAGTRKIQSDIATADGCGRAMGDPLSEPRR